MSETENEEHTNSSAEMWPMGAVTKRTGITEHTLRAWERRFGFPKPVRLPSGHRRFTSDQVRQLLLINRALRAGYRAGDVVPLSQGRIEALIRESDHNSPGVDPQIASRQWVEDILNCALAFDEASIRIHFTSDVAVLGVGRYLRERAAPLLEELGEAWARGDIGVRHEHFVSEILDSHLRGLRGVFEKSAKGNPVVLACLQDELHGLGLEMVAAEIASCGRSTIVLGPRTPHEEIVSTAVMLEAAVVGLSISAFAPQEPTLEMVTTLRTDLPGSIPMWLGGSGAEFLDKLPDNVRRLTSLDDVAEAVRSLRD